MHQFLRTCLVYLKLKIQEVLTYRIVIITWSVVFVIPLVAAASVWLGGEAISSSFGGYTRQQIITYYFIFLILGQVFSSYIFFSTMDEIINGKLPQYLLKPFSYFAAKTVSEVGWRLIDTLIRLPIYIAIALLVPQFLHPEISGASLLLFAGAILIGAAIYHLIAFIFGLLAFWFTRIEAFHGLYFVIFVFLSGTMAPIQLYPEPVSFLLRLLPFRYIFSFPVELYLGKLTSVEIISGGALSLVWLVVLTWSWRALWRKGLAQYSAYGG